MTMGLIALLKQSRFSQLLLAITFLTSGIILNLIQCTLYYFVRPFNKYLFRKINYYVNYSLYCQLVFIAQYWANIKLTVHIKKSDYDKYYGKEHGYLIMNHTYEIDWLVGWILCENVRVLGNCKTYAKKSIQYIPTMGYAWKFGESVFLERNWEKDKEIIGNQLKELVNYPDPMWLLLMAEGTRFTKEKHEASKAFAKEKGLPVLLHHLTPRTRGFTRSLPYLKEKVPAIYNVILGFKPNGVTPTMSNVLMGKSIDANMYMERIPISEVPDDEAEAAAWLHDLYTKKDKMLDSYTETGSWFEKSGVEKFDGFLLPRRIFPFLNTLGWAITILVPMGYYIYRILLSGNTLYVTTACVIIVSFFFLLHKLIGQTKISKGSSYGASSPTTPTNGYQSQKE